VLPGRPGGPALSEPRPEPPTDPSTSESSPAEPPAGEPSAAEPSTADLSRVVRAAVGRLYRRFRSQRGTGELGDAATGVLAYLQRSGARTLTELAERDRVTPATMSQIVNRLARSGYVERSADPRDGRKVLLSATDIGAARAVAERAEREAWFNPLLDELGPEDRAVLARAAELLQRIADAP